MGQIVTLSQSGFPIFHKLESSTHKTKSRLYVKDLENKTRISRILSAQGHSLMITLENQTKVFFFRDFFLKKR